MKRCLVILLVAVLLFPIISSASIDSEMQKLTHYAEQYETGNIDYVQLLIYSSATREALNEMLGASGKEFGGVLLMFLKKISNWAGMPRSVLLLFSIISAELTLIFSSFFS